MKIEQVDHVPVIPPAPWLAERERQLKAELVELNPVNSVQVSEAEQAWRQHKQENDYDPKVIAFGKPTGPADALLPYAKAARQRRLEQNR